MTLTIVDVLVIFAGWLVIAIPLVLAMERMEEMEMEDE